MWLGLCAGARFWDNRCLADLGIEPLPDARRLVW
jgi:hypothetical protein